MPDETFQDIVEATKTAAVALRDASARLTENIGKEADSAAKDARRSLMKVSERASKDMDKLIRDLEEAYPGLLPPRAREHLRDRERDVPP